MGITRNPICEAGVTMLKEGEWKRRIDEIAKAKQTNERAISALTDEVLRSLIEEVGKDGG